MNKFVLMLKLCLATISICSLLLKYFIAVCKVLGLYLHQRKVLRATLLRIRWEHTTQERLTNNLPSYVKQKKTATVKIREAKTKLNDSSKTYIEKYKNT